ncbi:MAG: hypothetical protein KF861_17675 [Planctomycetaceae bacterium]|nr:hypothetical protein [Planctomycetaceae bacterium]
MLQRLLPQPALRDLLLMRTRARIRRLQRSFSSPHRVLFSSIAIVLPVVWAVNFAASMLFRERFSADAFRSGVLLTGVGYSLWYVLKACIHRPAAAIEWTPAEESLICGGPFRRSDLIRYRLAQIFSATFLKAAFSSIMFLPELALWWTGFVGMLLGLAILDLARLAVETVLCGLSDRSYRLTRLVVFLLAGTGLASAATSAVTSNAMRTRQWPSALALPIEFAHQLAALRDTLPGQILSVPLLPFVEVISAERVSWSLLGWLAVSACLTATCVPLVIRLDAEFASRSAAAARRSYSSVATDRRSRRRATPEPSGLPLVARVRGAGPIAWRQWQGVRKYQTGLLLALGVPAALSCLPLIERGESIETFLNVAGMLCLYSFLLLPAALKFDFRRDYDRLPILKTLPVRPLAIVVGQLATPIVLSTMLQVFVLAIAFLVCPVPLTIAVNALLMIIPLNVVIFGLDNLIYLMYPYRQSEEGLQPFVRATLTFTAKGLLFATAIAFVYLWAVSCRRMSDFPVISGLGDHRLLFAAGLWAMMIAVGAGLVILSARVFDRFDPCIDHIK